VKVAVNKSHTIMSHNSSWLTWMTERSSMPYISEFGQVKKVSLKYMYNQGSHWV